MTAYVQSVTSSPAMTDVFASHMKRISRCIILSIALVPVEIFAASNSAQELMVPLGLLRFGLAAVVMVTAYRLSPQLFQIARLPVQELKQFANTIGTSNTVVARVLCAFGSIVMFVWGSAVLGSLVWVAVSLIPAGR